MLGAPKVNNLLSTDRRGSCGLFGDLGLARFVPDHRMFVPASPACRKKDTEPAFFRLLESQSTDLTNEIWSFSI